MRHVRMMELYSIENGYVHRGESAPVFFEDVMHEVTRKRREQARKNGENPGTGLWASRAPLVAVTELNGQRMPLLKTLSIMAEHGFGGPFDLKPGGFDLVFYREGLDRQPQEEIARLRLTEDRAKRRAGWHVVKMNTTYDELIGVSDILSACGVRHGLKPEDYPLIF